MFKIFYGVLLSALILIVSIACSTTTDDSVSDVEFYTHEQQYNKLLTYTSELESKITDLENLGKLNMEGLGFSMVFLIY